jgi:3-hydroxyacyl-[acyl-carrier-protein] dehydratase
MVNSAEPNLADRTYRETLCVSADHPSLPGHFPGNPVVPGVVLLDAVAGALRRWSGHRVQGLPQVKFLLPLLPGQSAQIELSLIAQGRVRFAVRCAERLIASGDLEISA